MNLDYSHHHRSNMESPDAEDDAAFYAQLTRQILLLMDEDHEETHSRNVESRRSLVRGGCGSSLTSGGNYNYFSWCDYNYQGGSEVPSWMERLWTASKAGPGTGVFIPRAVAAGKSRRRRHNKPKKNNVDGGRILHSFTAGHKINIHS